MTAPFFSVIVLSYESGRYLDRCISALKAQTFTDFELILADNGSKDGAAEQIAANDPSITFLQNGENLGFAEGNNRAAYRARGQWLVLVNPDAFAEPDFLAEVQAGILRHPSVPHFACYQGDAENPELMDGVGDIMTGWGFPYRAGIGHKRRSSYPEGSVFGSCGASMVIKRGLWNDIGGFDPDYFCYDEDGDLSYQVRLRGYSCIFLPKARVEHMGSATLGYRSRFATFHGFRNRFLKYLKLTPPLLLAVTLLPFMVLILLQYPIQARRGQLKTALEATADFFRLLPRMWAKRAVLAQSRTVSSFELARAMTWNPLKMVRREIDIRRI